MKKLLTIIMCVMLLPLPAMAEIYDCVEDASTGYGLNKGKIKSARFTKQIYSLDLDLENNRILNDELFLSKLYYDNGTARCERSASENILLCTNTIGNGLSIDLNSLRFTYATFWPVEEDQTAHISHGKCKKS
ncbi:MAG: hypothetical protein K0U39_08755 [Alphaproteobacteria bacterium]|nr:hypothetical protein [Alphaproteobacteria bacterium]